MAVPTRDFPDLFRAPGGVPAGTKCRRKADWVYLAPQSPLHGFAMLSVSKKWPKPLFRVFARGCMHAFGAHLPLEKCKKPRTGRGFLRIDRGRADDPFRYIGFSTVWAWLCHAVPPLHKGGCGVPPLAYCAPALGKQRDAAPILRSRARQARCRKAKTAPLCKGSCRRTPTEGLTASRRTRQ